MWQESERLRGKQRQAWGALNQVSEGPSARAIRLPIGGQREGATLEPWGFGERGWLPQTMAGQASLPSDGPRSSR